MSRNLTASFFVQIQLRKKKKIFIIYVSLLNDLEYLLSSRNFRVKAYHL